MTLIELMVAIAALGVAITAVSHEVEANRARSQEALVRERAQQVLEYEARALLRGKPSAPAVREALLAEVPRGALSAETAGEATVLKVSFVLDGCPTQESLTLLRRRP
jgi:prepilin-type N-terminal cleavage/methylation domain-containing protein